MSTTIHPDAIQNLVNGTHGDPFGLLGPHANGDGKVSIRVFRPTAKALAVIQGKERAAMKRLNEAGFFEVTLDGPVAPYQIEETPLTGDPFVFADPYQFGSLFSDMDLYLLGEGRHYDSYEKLGAHLREIDGVKGVHFAVWAPHAHRVSVVGDFNRWDARVHPMRRLIDNGIWEIFIPGLEQWTLYKFDLDSTVNSYRAQKIDPYGYYNEMRPHTASVVVDLEAYPWGDDAWMKARPQREPLREPMSIYEVHLGSWRRKTNDMEWLTYREAADALVQYIKDMGYTHIELLPITEFPLDISWGYQVTGYYAATSRYGTPHDLMYLIDLCHRHDIGVLLDWVPAHFPKDGHALSFFDGTHLYEHEDSRLGEHPQWGTYIFNYARNEVRNFLTANALFWLKKYHIDGLRVDAVSSMLYLNFGRENGDWLPNQYGGNENLPAIEFMREANIVVHEQCPGCVTIAEESSAWPMVSRPVYLGGLGFTLKWNMGWMHDTLKYFSHDPVHRRWHHNNLTFSMMYAFTENFVLSLSHDEVVHGKGSLINKIPGDWWQKFATLRVLLGYQMTHPGKKLIFMGGEFGQFREWSESRSLDWHLVENFPTHRGVLAWSRDLNRFYRTQPALYERDFDDSGFRWIEANDAEQSVFSYIRFAADPRDFLVVIFNCTPVPRHNYRIGVPEAGFYKEMLNSDSSIYGGGNVGNVGGLHTDNIAWHQGLVSLNLTVPPLGLVVLKLQREEV